MRTPDSPESVEEGLTRVMAMLPEFLRGKTPHQKQMLIAELFGGAIFSPEHGYLGYWTVSTRLGSGMFSLERDTFLELPEGKGMEKYFSTITSKGVIPLSDGSLILTLCFGGEQVSARDLIGIERFCYIEDGQIHAFGELPRPCSLQMAITIFQTKRNEMIARGGGSKKAGGSDTPPKGNLH